jgi:hypothetical protein
VASDLAGDQVADGDPLRLAVHHHEIEHFGAREHLHRPQLDLAGERRVGAQQKLLPRLTAGVEGPGDLGAPEGTVVQVTSVVARERDALRDALVDDVVAHLGQAPHVRLASAEVAALDGVVEEAVDAVPVIGVVLAGVDPALRRDAVGATGAVLVAKCLHVVTKLSQRRRSGCAGQPGPDHQDLVLALVRRVHQLHFETVLVPRLFDRSGRTFSVEYQCKPPIW